MTNHEFSNGVTPEGLMISRVFQAPQEAVFDAWTTPEKFAQWFGLRDARVPVERIEMDVQPGGAWRAVMFAGPEGVELQFAGEYREVLRPDRLVLTLTNSGDPHDVTAEVMTVLFSDIGDGNSAMRFTQTGGNLSVEEYERASAGWAAFFIRLAELVS